MKYIDLFHQSIWNIIESTDHEVIYEWSLSKKQDGYLPQHEISKAFFTESGFHRIGITIKSPTIKAQQRSEAMSLLKDSVAIVPIVEAREGTDLSIVEKLKSSLDLESVFADWKMKYEFEKNDGYAGIGFTPKQTKNNISECVDIFTRPKFTEISVDTIFEADKNYLETQTDEKIKYEVIKKNKSEIIYTYTYPFEKLKLSVIVRAFLTDKGYYSIAYKTWQDQQMKKEDVLFWTNTLKKIKVKS